MTVFEAESIIRKIGFPRNEEEQAKYSKATYVILKAIQDGWNVAPVRNWADDLISVGEEIREKNRDLDDDEIDDKDLYLLKEITNNMMMISLIMMETKMKDIEELE